MKKTKLKKYAALFLVLLFCFSNSLPVSAVNPQNILKDGTKTENPYSLKIYTKKSAELSKPESRVYPIFIPKESVGKTIPLSAEYFEMRMGWNSGELAGITITSLPRESDGKLMLDGVEVQVYDTIFRSELDRLCYVQDEDALQLSSGWFSFIPICSSQVKKTQALPHLCATFQIIPKNTERPLVQDVFCKTVSDTKIQTALPCFTSNSQSRIIYTLNKKPKKGSVSLSGENCIYTPNEGETGSDRFVLTAFDENGGISSPIQVRVMIESDK